MSAFAPLWVEGVFGDAMARTAGLARMVHLEQGLSVNDYLLADVVKAAAALSEPS